MSSNGGSSDAALALRRSEAARLLGVSEKHLANMKEIPVIRLGKKCVRYRRADLEAYLKAATGSGIGVRED